MADRAFLQISAKRARYMSFILDALKKSEADRQGKGKAETAYVHSGSPAPAQNKWIWLVGFLLTLNIVVLLVVLLKPDRGATPAVTTVVSKPAVTAEDESASFRERVNEVRRSQPQAPPAVDSPAVVRNPATQSQSTQEPARTPAPIASDADTTEPSTSTVAYKTLNELLAEGTLQMQELRIDIHVYSETPVDRFVFINMTKYKENAILSEGPVVAEIVPDGVILDYQGVRFLLPRE